MAVRRLRTKTTNNLNLSIFHLLPQWLVFLIFLGLLIGSLELGNLVGARRQNKHPKSTSGGRNAILNSMFGVLGLLLAFTFGTSVNYHLNRQQAVVAEANALGTAFQWAGLVPDPGRTELRTGLVEYAQTRTAEHGKPMNEDELVPLIETSVAARDRLWPTTEAIVAASSAGPIEASLAASVNEVINADTDRMAAIIDTLPPVILLLLLAITVATAVLEGFNSGFSHAMNRGQTTTLALVLASILLMIVDFDRPRDGFIRVRQDSIRAVIDQMNSVHPLPSQPDAND